MPKQLSILTRDLFALAWAYAAAMEALHSMPAYAGDLIGDGPDGLPYPLLTNRANRAAKAVLESLDVPDTPHLYVQSDAECIEEHELDAAKWGDA